MKPVQFLLIVSAFFWGALSAAAESRDLPVRQGPIPGTTKRVPHVQIGAKADPKTVAALVDRVSGIPGVEIRDTIISLPGAKGFWLGKDVPVARPKTIVAGREFAHVHPDGSLHASLPLALAMQAVETGWAVNHPWANQRPGWEGFVMIFTPTNAEELDVVLDLVQASYNFVTGQE